MRATNNQAEYEALIAGLKLDKALRIQNLKIYSDSQIVVKQTNGEYIANDPVLAKYQALVQSYLALIPKSQVIQIYREENSEVDTLSKLVQNSSDLDCSVYFEELQRPSIESEEVMEIDNIPNWMTPFINYLEKGELSEDKGKAQRLKAKAAKFFIEEGILQLFSNVTRTSPVLPSSVLSPIPFAVWGIDIMGPFPRARGDLRYLLVLIDYMTKWVEAKAMRTINQQDCIKFMDNILIRKGYPTQEIIRSLPSRKWPSRSNQSNPSPENEKRLRESKTKWQEELPNVLWAYRTSPRTSTGEMPFKLAYGTEAMLPIEVGSPSHRAINFDEIANEEGLRTNIELIDEVRDQDVARMEKYKEKTKEHFSKKSWVKNFQVRDLVLRDTEASDPTNTGKLMPRWEGPYKIKEVLRLGTYKLMNMDESEIPNTWHGLRLRKFYQ
ncbi:hypothetical protein AgCh_005306 [Apium graveolens]